MRGDIVSLDLLPFFGEFYENIKDLLLITVFTWLLFIVLS